MSLCGVSVVYEAKAVYMYSYGAAIPIYSLCSRRSPEPNFEVFGIAPNLSCPSPLRIILLNPLAKKS